MTKTNANDFLGKDVTVKIDRKLGTRHPKHGFMYMLNYGFIPNTISGDGEELARSRELAHQKYELMKLKVGIVRK